MKKWCLLLSGLATWVALGLTVARPQRTVGRPGEFRAIPSRIVSMAPNLTEILCALGLEPEIVGVTDDSDYPPEAANKPKVGSFWQPGVEAVIATRPDLVVVLAFEQQRELARRLDRMGYDCLVVDIQTIDGLFEAILSIGRATTMDVQAKTLHDRMLAAIHRFQVTTKGLAKVKTLWVVQREPLRVAGRGTFIDKMIELAGGENAVGPTLHKYPPIGSEQVIASAPEVIIEPTMVSHNLGDQCRQAVAFWNRFATIPAVTTGRIYVINGDVVSRLSPRLPIGIEIVAKCLRPELFGE